MDPVAGNEPAHPGGMALSTGGTSPATRYSLPRSSIADDTWTVFGALTFVTLLLVAGYCAWKAFPTRSEGLAVEEHTVAPSIALTPPANRPTASTPVPSMGLPLASSGQPVSWQELTLMLRTGLNDAEIIAAFKGRPLASPIYPAQAATLRELGAGTVLLSYLQTRATSSSSPMAPRVVVTAPPLPRAAVLATPRAVPTPTPVDYAAKDRQIKSLQLQIDAIDAEILRVRNHPSFNPFLIGGSYNGRGYHDGEESSLKKYLDQLDQQRNDLRRQKWQLEGR